MRESTRVPTRASRRAAKRVVRALLAAVFMVAPIACDGGDPSDGGPDGSRRDAALDGRVDAAPLMCTPTCPMEQACCALDLMGTNGCVSLIDDPRHCGSCGVNCLATGRGDRCELSGCACGTSTLGCRGTRQSTCCQLPGLVPYCGNLDTDGDNCGECGRLCDARVGDRCDGGECRCGGNRISCLGTPESTCCQNGVDVACTDTTTDRFNCGVCNNLCQGAERCAFGSCTRGAGDCPAGCDVGEVCCDGACCTRAACMAGTCGGSMDGGMADGGTSDAGDPDAGMSDAGDPDAGAPDAGVDAGP
ncbi:MAG: hypothetical protein AB7S26_41045 [Sandaracinaceae bacterium]